MTWRTAARYGVVREVEVASTTDRHVRGRGPGRLRRPAARGRHGADAGRAEQPARRVQACRGRRRDRARARLPELDAHRQGRPERVALDDRRVAGRPRRRRPPALRAPGRARSRPAAPSSRSTRSAARRAPTWSARTSRSLPASAAAWSVVADVDQSAADVVRLQTLLADPAAAAAALAADVEGTRAHLDRLVGTADAAQVTGDELATAHHRANVLFNIMRGGVLVDGYTVRTADLRAFVGQRSPRTADRSRRVVRRARRDRAGRRPRRSGPTRPGDPDLLRLVREYLPLTFSRRHGDPSRPVERVHASPCATTPASRCVDYQGNWRDIFQNWEALAWSFPEYVESMVAMFLDASTADGYNPYRISRAGIDWEVPEPRHPWANIGYWGDHQVIYLVKLLEASRAVPPRSPGGARRPAPSSRTPTCRTASRRTTSGGRADRDDRRSTRRRSSGSSGASRPRAPTGELVHGADGELVRVSLGEKLLLTILAKVVNLVPDGGIWMNTQRPEWNDANNALVGKGLSVVTLAYLRRALTLARDLLTGDLTGDERARELLTRRARGARRDRVEPGGHRVRRPRPPGRHGRARAPRAPRTARACTRGFSGGRTQVPARSVQAFLDGRAGLRRRRAAGEPARRTACTTRTTCSTCATGRPSAGCRRCSRARSRVLSSGAADPGGGAGARPGAASQRAVPGGPAHLPALPRPRAADVPGAQPHHRGAGRVRAAAGGARRGRRHVGRAARRARRAPVRARPAQRPATLDAALDALAVPPAVGRRSPARCSTLFEQVFRHAEFTGRSGSFFAYEGLGSIYWHMVSKLLLAVQENHERARGRGRRTQTSSRACADAYEDIRARARLLQDPRRVRRVPRRPVLAHARPARAPSSPA